jgi:hypothetical protein
VRIVDEWSEEYPDGLVYEAGSATPWLDAHDGELRQLDGPAVDGGILGELKVQIGADELGDRRWALAPARVGPSVDLVAEGSRLRSHAIVNGVLVRTIETLAYKHAADRAANLADAAAAYSRLAAAAIAMHRAGGRLAAIDAGFLVVEYPA